METKIAEDENTLKKEYIRKIAMETGLDEELIAAQFDNPVLLFSGGKDSILVSYLAKKAFFPAKIPFPFFNPFQ